MKFKSNIDLDNNQIENIKQMLFDTNLASPGTTEGTVSWNHKEYTLDVVTGLGPVLQLGQETVMVFFNDTGSVINNFRVLHLKGGALYGGETYPTMELADASKWEKCQGTLAICTSNVGDGELGLATVFGIAKDGDTSEVAAGAQLWLSTDGSGKFTDVQPTFPNFKISLGGAYNSSLTEGKIFINITRDVYDIFNDAWDGTFLEPFNFLVSSDGTDVIGTLKNKDITRNLNCNFSDGFYTLDTTTTDLTIALTPGSDIIPVMNYIYLPISTKILTVSTSGFPTEEHIVIGTVFLRSAASTQANGPLKNHNWNDPIKDLSGNGHLLHIAKAIRKKIGATWQSGVELTASVITNAGVPDDVFVSTTSGIVMQMHDQAVSAMDLNSADVALVVNDNTTSYKQITNLNTELLDAGGITMETNTFSFVIWGVANKTGQNPRLMVNLPISSYNIAPAFGVSLKEAINDINNYAVYDIPSEFQGTGFLIARITLSHETTNGGTWTLENVEDLRGKIPNLSAGGAAGGTGVTTFLGLTDTVNSYLGLAGYFMKVNEAESGLEAVALATVATSGAHSDLSEIGTNTHAQIDMHIASMANPHGVTAAQVGNGTAQWNANKIQGVLVDDTNKADGYMLAFNETSGNIEYVQGGAAVVTSVFGRTGDVIAAVEDYSAYYPQLATNNTFTGDLTLDKTTPYLVLDSDGTTDYAVIWFKSNGLNRWYIGKVDDDDLAFSRQDALGDPIDHPLRMDIDTGVCTFAQSPLVGSDTIWHAGNDGSGSGLDADTVDGIQATSFLRKDQDDTSTGKIFAANQIIAKGGYGSVGLVLGDGYGNANLTFNHTSAVPDISGNSARIEVNTSGTVAFMKFQLASNVTAGVKQDTPTILTIDETQLDSTVQIRAQNVLSETNLYMSYGTTGSSRYIYYNTDWTMRWSSKYCNYMYADFPIMSSGNTIRYSNTSGAAGYLGFYTSSIRFKDNVRIVEDENVDPMGIFKIYPKIFNEKPNPNRESDGKNILGYIAEEVGAVFPDAVFYEEDGVTVRSYSEDAMTAHIHLGLHEVYKRVLALEDEVDELELETETLEDRVALLEGKNKKLRTENKTLKEKHQDKLKVKKEKRKPVPEKAQKYANCRGLQKVPSEVWVDDAPKIE